jgi:hypothetical protein
LVIEKKLQDSFMPVGVERPVLWIPDSLGIPQGETQAIGVTVIRLHALNPFCNCMSFLVEVLISDTTE